MYVISYRYDMETLVPKLVVRNELQADKIIEALGKESYQKDFVVEMDN